MKQNLIMMSALALTLVGSGCATKKYVAKTMAPVEARVTASEGKNAEQDKTIAGQAEEIGTLQASLSRTNERVTDADSKAAAAGQSAAAANTAAAAAQRTADGANTVAGNAMTAANNAMTATTNVERNLSRKIDASVTLKKSMEETVLFATNQATLSKEAKEALDQFAAGLNGKDRYVVEVQGFTDKTGSADANTVLSQRRAEAVTRYLVNEHNVPLHMVTTMGSGYASPTGDDKTRDGRKANRRVEIRLFEPESASLSASN